MERLQDLLQSPAPDGAWMERVARWVLAHPADGRGGHCPRTSALRLLQTSLEAPEHRDALEAIRTFASRRPAVRLLAEMGLPEHGTFLQEAFQRLQDKVLPRLDPVDDLYAWLDRLEPGPGDADWLRGLPEDLAAWWFEVMRPDPASLQDACRLLAHRIAGLGLHRDVLTLVPRGRDLDSPFVRLEGVLEDPEAFRTALMACRVDLEAAHAGLDDRGVSTPLVYRLDLLAVSLDRLEVLQSVHWGGVDLRELAADLVMGAGDQHRLRPLLRGTLVRLSRKIVEHSGRTGEHYLARSREAYWAMGAAAAGGGALTAGTALFKVLAGGIPVAPGPMGLLLTANYAGSFLLMQVLHLSLASKQPAATAAALASALPAREPGGTGTPRPADPAAFEAELDMVAALARGQVAATLGNLLAAMPVAFLMDLVWRWALGHAFLTPAKAQALLASLHPLSSWTLPFAAFTGVILWLGSLAGGWAHNWSAHRNLPEAVSGSRRVQGLLGARGATRLGDLLARHLPGAVSCLALGFMLGLLPLLLAFAGVPLDVRHVTLSAASLAFAVAQGQAAGQVPWGPAAWAMVGVLCIGFLNFSVSFLLSLRLALRARDVPEAERAALWRALRQALRRQPGRFLWPRREDA